jgi:DNA processing protein
LQHDRSLAVVGTRDFSDYGSEAVNQLIQQVASYHPCIVSGLAAGIDALAHRAALANQLPTVAVFGTGIDKIFPSSNTALAKAILAAGGALISEYPMGFTGDRSTFPQRNRIIAGLSQGTLVVEGPPTSGAMITAKYATAYQRTVMAVPGSIFRPNSEGPNRLIQYGAMPVAKGRDIAEAIGWRSAVSAELQQTLDLAAPGQLDSKPPEAPDLSPSEKEVLAVIRHEPTSFEEITARKPQYTVMALNSILTMLELSGRVTALPGAQFCRN